MASPLPPSPLLMARSLREELVAASLTEPMHFFTTVKFPTYECIFRKVDRRVQKIYSHSQCFAATGMYHGLEKKNIFQNIIKVWLTLLKFKCKKWKMKYVYYIHFSLRGFFIIRVIREKWEKGGFWRERPGYLKRMESQIEGIKEQRQKRCGL